MDLHGKTAIVTGGSHGIGLAIVKALLNEGCNVATIARNEGELAPLIEEHPGLLFLKGSIADIGCVKAFVAETAERFGGVDILINNAGVSVSERNPVEDSDVEECTQVVMTNLLGSFYLSHEALPYLKRRPHGYVIHILSIVAHNSSPGKSMYTASKFGQRGLCDVMIKENRGSNVRVSSISPGGTNSNIWNLKKDVPSDEVRATLLKTEDVANAAIFLLKQPDYVHIEDLKITSWHSVI